MVHRDQTAKGFVDEVNVGGCFVNEIRLLLSSEVERWAVTEGDASILYVFRLNLPDLEDNLKINM